MPFLACFRSFQFSPAKFRKPEFFRVLPKVRNDRYLLHGQIGRGLKLLLLAVRAGQILHAEGAGLGIDSLWKMISHFHFPHREIGVNGKPVYDPNLALVAIVVLEKDEEGAVAGFISGSVQIRISDAGSVLCPLG